MNGRSKEPMHLPDEPDSLAGQPMPEHCRCQAAKAQVQQLREERDAAVALAKLNDTSAPIRRERTRAESAERKLAELRAKATLAYSLLDGKEPIGAKVTLGVALTAPNDEQGEQ